MSEACHTAFTEWSTKKHERKNAEDKLTRLRTKLNRLAARAGISAAVILLILAAFAGAAASGVGLPGVIPMALAILGLSAAIIGIEAVLEIFKCIWDIVWADIAIDTLKSEEQQKRTALLEANADDLDELERYLRLDGLGT